MFSRIDRHALRRLAAGSILFVTACGPATSSPASDPSATSTASVVPSAPTVTSSPGPATSPSGSVAVGSGETWISFQWIDEGGHDGIFLVRPDGTGRHELAPDLPGIQHHPDWSPDGEQLAFIQTPPDGPDELWVIEATGTGARKLMSCDLPCNTLNYPDWSPDGSAIYVGLDADASGGAPPTTFTVARADVAGGSLTTVLSRKDGLTAEQPRISPDGTTIAFDRGEITGTTGMAIYVADLKGGRERRLTDPKLFGAHPDWSVDGLLVFNSYDLGFFQDTSEASNLYTMKADGSGLRQLTSYGTQDTRATQPRFTPDGTAIVYTQVEPGAFGTRTLAMMNADGTGARSLTATPMPGTHPQLRPLP
jgi:Tol biopolymer transport system component